MHAASQHHILQSFISTPTLASHKQLPTLHLMHCSIKNKAKSHQLGMNESSHGKIRETEITEGQQKHLHTYRIRDSSQA
jgi:hypothetical protein